MYTLLIILLVIALVVLVTKLYTLYDQRERIRRLFIDLTKNFENEGVIYWVDFGTLLGITRDGDIIFGDNDADVCIYDTKENRHRVEKVVKSMGGEYLDWGAYRVYDNKLFIDIYIVKETESEFKVPTGEVIHRSLVEPVKSQNCKIGSVDVQLSLPNDVYKVLENRYGQTWHVSKRKWYTMYIDIEKDFNS
jgi:hypothetical protein